MTSVVPAKYDRPPYPEYWLKPVSERALSTNVGTNRFNWDLRYDDPQAYNPDINNQMNASPGSVTPAPHGPLALPGTYTVKLTVDGQTYTQPLVLHNDPRVGESPAILAAIRSQNRLALESVRGMNDSYAANEEVASVRAQIAALLKGSAPADVTAAANALDKKLATFGAANGRAAGGGGFGRQAQRAPGSILPFYTINGTYNTVLGPISQNGIDMPPTPAMIHTYESACREYTSTADAWKALTAADIASFNSLLTKNNLTPLKLTPSAISAPPACTFTTGGR
jgi:hypothetical protein